MAKTFFFADQLSHKSESSASKANFSAFRYN